MFIIIGFVCMFEDLFFSKSMGLLDFVAWICFVFFSYLEWTNSSLCNSYLLTCGFNMLLVPLVKCSFKNGGFFTTIKIWSASSSYFQSRSHFFVLVPTLQINSLHSLLLRVIVLSIGSNHFFNVKILLIWLPSLLLWE